jgi:hypothetical protein
MARGPELDPALSELKSALQEHTERLRKTAAAKLLGPKNGYRRGVLHDTAVQGSKLNEAAFIHFFCNSFPTVNVYLPPLNPL